VGAGSNLFHQGVAKESSDPEVIAATMSKPGVVLRRPVGSDAPFSEHPDLPTQLADDEPRHRPEKTSSSTCLRLYRPKVTAVRHFAETSLQDVTTLLLTV
jgi:colicin import membrane protein